MKVIDIMQEHLSVIMCLLLAVILFFIKDQETELGIKKKSFWHFAMGWNYASTSLHKEDTTINNHAIQIKLPSWGIKSFIIPA